ncbi:MAG: hypothetical protein UR69_C0001G0217 [Candidatus Moranbacteria bacterium GW2011_GWE2_35_2-]|nr:MAG: hypothetical protein UR69_C0001G0217 [Candidatus Moranbacteria bacterium GW2011_GWE2_35_2-]KKQ06623.1 MAG: hypothetical protein US15_C0007G0004 [Candidatus Moranbacteria bacterium GW2011_GWF1_36_4]KKQ22785.1 MAG: hypothetical protein US37_C0001G0057 [Candidatus Moranbacteria bacterium GW2011_GWF2_37_11]KKQ28796.1 MAG: hypothetical protein US44_C0006G0016 [Candidatus Moranbacteria bacterium GW2011_GWD1_37_17]KKQ30984.1 MAG: hypothetical protein US47_C0001G0217 [Candidatus Moranbacteria b
MNNIKGGKKFFKKRLIIGGVFLSLIFVAGYYLMTVDKKDVILSSISAFEKIFRLLPVEKDTKDEVAAINNLAAEFIKKDDIEKRFLILLQNNMELRPGGGFLGQYAILKIKNGEVISTVVEDANLLDQRITTKVVPPYPFTRMMSIKKWKFRDSNFSPDFPTNTEKAKYFYRLSGGNSNFDGVIAVNSDVFANVLKLTGPITVPGYATEFTSENAVLKLEEVVEKAYIENPNIDTTNRKAIMKIMANVIIEKLAHINNIPKISEFVLEELRNKNVMFNFNDAQLQASIEKVHWDGKVAQDWNDDYLMMVDANMGALKSDYFIDRSVSYNIDLTTEKPTVELKILYKHNATYGDWRTSDYHSYLRVYVPKGSTLIDRKMVSYPLIDEDFGKTYFGFICHVLINGQTEAYIKYELPSEFKEKEYRLLIQKQSGVGDVPIKVHMKNSKGEFDYEGILKKDLNLEFSEN